jgi:hypothetical protein
MIIRPLDFLIGTVFGKVLQNIRMKIMFIGLAVLFTALVSSCSPKIPFTQSIREQYKLTPEELRGIQFYVSDQVVLRRAESNTAQKTTEEGRLIIESGKSIEQFTIRNGTRGALERVPDGKNLMISFEEGAERQLVFGSGQSRSGYYSLQALSWEDGRGLINYAGQSWYATEQSRNAILLFKMKSIRKLRVDTKVAKGKRVR